MPNLVPLYGKDKKIFPTADGSFSFFNLSYDEAYRAKSVGAYSESLYKFVYGSNIISKLKKSNVSLLDICFGLGYNIATTIDQYYKNGCKGKLKIYSLEIDTQVVQLVKESIILFPKTGYEILKILIDNGAYENFSLEIVYGDASKTMFQLNNEFDVIYFDPFSKSKNPEMWNKNIYNRLFELLKKDGNIVTYACSKKIREDFRSTGFIFEDIKNLPKEFRPGTIFKKTNNLQATNWGY